MSMPAPNDRFAILAHKVKEADRVIIRARKVWQSSQARYFQLVETMDTPETVTGAAWVDTSATYEVYLDAVKVKGDFLRAIAKLKQQFDAARRALRDRGLSSEGQEEA